MTDETPKKSTAKKSTAKKSTAKRKTTKPKPKPVEEIVEVIAEEAPVVEVVEAPVEESKSEAEVKSNIAASEGQDVGGAVDAQPAENTRNERDNAQSGPPKKRLIKPSLNYTTWTS